MKRGARSLVSACLPCAVNLFVRALGRFYRREDLVSQGVSAEKGEGFSGGGVRAAGASAAEWAFIQRVVYGRGRSMVNDEDPGRVRRGGGGVHCSKG